MLDCNPFATSTTIHDNNSIIYTLYANQGWFLSNLYNSVRLTQNWIPRMNVQYKQMTWL